MKILIIKTSSLGDIIHSFPAIEDIKKNYPESRLDFLVDSTFLSTAKLNQSIDNFFSISLRETKNQSFMKRLMKLNEEINASFKNISYDFVIDFQGLMRTQIIGSKIKKISSSKNFIGYSFKSAKEGLLTLLYDKGINVTKDEHAVMRMKKLAAESLNYELNKEHDYGFKQEGLDKKNKIIFVHGSSRRNKEYPLDYWKKLADHLNNLNLDICIPVHGENQLNYFEEINKINSRAFKLETDNFLEIKEEFDKCSFFIGVDTGLTHICAGLGLSGIFLFGPTDPSKVGPVFDHQRVIKKSKMTEINPSLIIEMLKEESFE